MEHDHIIVQGKGEEVSEHRVMLEGAVAPSP